MKSVEAANAIIKEMETKLINHTNHPHDQCANELKVGVDLGTSTIVLIVLNKRNQPVIGAMEPARVVKDGIVVDFIGAVKVLKRLKDKVEKKLGLTLHEAVTAIPPGILQGNIKIITNVVEAAGFTLSAVVDEPVGAAKLLNINNGAVVDIGGGTTGISVLKNGHVEYSVDEATGGHHLTLVLSGSMNLTYEEAEKYKMKQQNNKITLPIVQPVIEKMAEITKRNITPEVEAIYLVGGTCCLEGVETIFQKYTGIRTVKPYNPLLITPIGIAMFAN